MMSMSIPVSKAIDIMESRWNKIESRMTKLENAHETNNKLCLYLCLYLKQLKLCNLDGIRLNHT